MGQSMMRRKLEEARYFRRWMERNANEPIQFGYELSAFLTAARSVLQYLYEDCGSKADRQWYQRKVTNPTIRFFKCRRNVNVHASPIEPHQEVTFAIEEQISLGESVSSTMKDHEGKVLRHQEISGPLVEPVANKVERKVEYRFAEWSGPEDVLSLSDAYLNALESILDDWGRKLANQKN